MVRIEYEIDIATRARFEELLKDGADTRPLLVDLAYCPFLDSTGLSALIKRHSEGSIMAIVLPDKGTVARVFELTKLDRVLNIFSNFEEAIAALARTPE